MGKSVFHVAGSVGAVQAGDNSVANVTMHAAAEQVASALAEIEGALTAQDASEDLEAVHVVRAARDEVRRPTLRLSVLKSLLFTVATTVQTLGAAEPAINALRDGAKALGIPLP